MIKPTVQFVRRYWDRLFLSMIPIVAIAAAIGLFFLNPIDNLIVIVWLPFLWLVVRYCARTVVPRPAVVRAAHHCDDRSDG